MDILVYIATEGITGCGVATMSDGVEVKAATGFSRQPGNIIDSTCLV